MSCYEQCVGDSEFVCSTKLEKQEAIAVVLACTVSSADLFLGLVDCPHSGVEVSEDKKFLRLCYCCNEGIQFFTELVLDVIWVDHCWGINADERCLFLVSKWKLKCYQAVNGNLWKFG